MFEYFCTIFLSTSICLEVLFVRQLLTWLLSPRSPHHPMQAMSHYALKICRVEPIDPQRLPQHNIRRRSPSPIPCHSVAYDDDVCRHTQQSPSPWIKVQSYYMHLLRYPSCWCFVIPTALKHKSGGCYNDFHASMPSYLLLRPLFCPNPPTQHHHEESQIQSPLTYALSPSKAHPMGEPSNRMAVVYPICGVRLQR